MGEVTQSIKTTMKEDMQVRQQIFHRFMEVVDGFPNIPIAQHIATFLRRKSESGPSFYYWSNKELLNHIEQYKQEIESDELNNETENS